MRQNVNQRHGILRKNQIKTGLITYTLFYQEMNKFQMRHKVKIASSNIPFKSHRNGPNYLDTQEKIGSQTRYRPCEHWNYYIVILKRVLH